jgi:NADPH2:quinone reductase
MPYKALVKKDGIFTISSFKDKETSEIPQGYILVNQKYFGLTREDLSKQSQINKVSTVGTQGVGTIEYVSPNCKRGFKVGNKVCYYSKLPIASSQKIIINEMLLIRMPTSIEKTEVGANVKHGIECHYLMHNMMKISKGTWVLINGASGSFGSYLCQYASKRGVNVIGLVSTEQKRQVAIQNGCKIALTYSENIAEAVMRVTENAGVMIIYDVIGKEFFNVGVPLMSYFGTYVSLSSISGDIGLFDINLLRPKSLFLASPSLENYKFNPIGLLVGGFEFLTGVEKGEIKPTIKIFNLKDYKDAMSAVMDRNRIGSVVIEF